jgi:hypothetical protein
VSGVQLFSYKFTNNIIFTGGGGGGFGTLDS